MKELVTVDSQDERGAVLIMGFLLIPIILSLIYIVIGSGSSRLLKSSMQNVADMTANAGSALIPMSPNFDIDLDSNLTRPLSTGLVSTDVDAGISNHLYGVFADLSVFHTGFRPSTLSNFVLNGFEIAVGRWRGDGSGFEEWTDDRTDQHDKTYYIGSPLNPSQSRNGVFVEFQYESRGLELIFNRASSSGFRVQALASFGEVDALPIAPFALFNCGLFNQLASNNRSMMFRMTPPVGPAHMDPVCAADRLITGLYGNSSGTEDESRPFVRPEFSWNPNGLADTISSQGMCSSGGNGKSWSNPSYPLPYNLDLSAYGDGLGDDFNPNISPSALFGVVGLPTRLLSSTTPLSESLIRDLISENATFDDPLVTVGPTVDASLGDEFSILFDGLTEATTGAAIWGQITNVFRVSPEPEVDASHPRYGDTELAGIQAILPETSACELSGLRDHHGSCNSQRYGYHASQGDCLSTQIQTGNAQATSTPPRTGFYDGVSFDTPVWEVIVPVIEIKRKVDSVIEDSLCPSSGGGIPVLHSGNTYEIVGFVQAYVYDVDVGQAAGNMTCASGGASPWGYNAGTTADTGDDSCNLVRLRVKCNSHFAQAANNPDSLSVPSTLVQ